MQLEYRRTATGPKPSCTTREFKSAAFGKSLHMSERLLEQLDLSREGFWVSFKGRDEENNFIEWFQDSFWLSFKGRFLAVFQGKR